MSSEPKTAKPSEPAVPAPAERPAASIRYLDRADMEETFADSIGGLIFRRSDAAHRIRRHALRRGQAQYPDFRPALSGLPSGAAAGGRAFDLINRMQQIATALTQQAGVVKQAAPRAAAEPPESELARLSYPLPSER